MLMERWVNTNKVYERENVKQVYYFSLEFLIGKMLDSNLIYLDIKNQLEEVLEELGICLKEIEEYEPDPGLGNGGLGRLAACFIDSMANLSLPGHGCGIRYKYGLFEQKIVNGYQLELPDSWLKEQSIWETRKSNKSVIVRFGGNVRTETINGQTVFFHEYYEPVLAVPYDIPVPSYHNTSVNTLRLWKSESVHSGFDFNSFSKGDYAKAREHDTLVEAISEVLYPDDSNYSNRVLRLKQQYFFVSAGLQSIIRRFKKKKNDIKNLPEKIAIHINDTHPAIAVPELMRILIDEEMLTWSEAWDITKRTISYTNHTIMPEALEKWSVDIIKPLLPRIFMIIDEINERYCKELWERYPDEWDRIRRMSIISDGYVHMANLAIVGSYSVNGVAAVHTQILKDELFNDFHKDTPQKINNKTNGITHRRWLLKANPGLSNLITESIGDEWIANPLALDKLAQQNFHKDPSFLKKLEDIKYRNKIRLEKFIGDKLHIKVDPNSMYDIQVKRIHAYKRQHLKVLHVLDLYFRLLENPDLDIQNRTFIFAGKAAPSYYYAKTMIKLINSVADMINSDTRVNERIKVIYLGNYSVSLGEMLFPASDLSEQISTASKEASGTGNMKFMMNGAITLGTMDGANIEISEAVGKDHFIVFGLSVEEVLNYYKYGGYKSWEVYYLNQRIRRIMDSMVDGTLPASRGEFVNIYKSLLDLNDEYFVLKDFASYIDAQEFADEKYKNKKNWFESSAVNIAKSGIFSSDVTINQYAKDIWNLKPSSLKKD